MDAACMPEPSANKQSDFDVKYVHPYRHGILLQGCEVEFVCRTYSTIAKHTSLTLSLIMLQTMLDEAVAIVMAPRDSRKKCGIFRLSTPGGLKLVQKCPERGFHAHPSTQTGQSLYELCGHVYLNPRVKHDVVDLR